MEKKNIKRMDIDKNVKIFCVECQKEGFDNIPFKELARMVGWIEPPEKEGGTWDVTLTEGGGFECSTQEIAQLMSSMEEIKSMLMENRK